MGRLRFHGEIATGWVRNIEPMSERGRGCSQSNRSEKDRDSITLSIKSVSEERRRDALQSWKNEQRASQI